MEAGQKDRYLQISNFLSGVAEVTELWDSGGRLLYSQSIGLDLLYSLLKLLAFHSFDLSDERAREQE